MLASRKSLRDFVQVEEPGRKCSLCGERQALPERFSREPAKQKQYEYLCATCAVKRFDADAWKVEKRFPSTSSVATAPFVLALLNKWATPEVTQTLIGFQNTLYDLEQLHHLYPGQRVLTNSAHPRAIPMLAAEEEKAIHHWDGDLYFPETFEPDGRLKNDYEFDEKNVEIREKAAVAEKKLRVLREAVLKATGQHPTPYYAVLLMDGDRMGKRLSGVQSEEEHKSISRALFHFAREGVPDIVERQHPGRLVYAGGDDVLALLPVAHVLAAAQKLQEAFGKTLAGGTMSAGIAIAHHLSPLQIALNEARHAEGVAKDVYDRNALCVTLLRRSGEAVQVGAQWSFGCGQETVNVLERVRKAMTEEHLSGRLAYNVAQVAPVLGADDFPRDAKAAEVRRLLRRQCKENLPDDEKKVIKGLAEPLVTLAEALDSLVRRNDRPVSGMEEMANWLLLMRFLAGEGRSEG